MTAIAARLPKWLSLSVGLLVTCPFVASSPAQAAGNTPAIRIVDAAEHVQSRKRGVCANHLEPADFQVLAPGVSWWYNWGSEPHQPVPADAKMEYFPMVWGSDPNCLAGLQKYLDTGAKPRRVLAINEPNLRGQAFISPEQTAELYKQAKAIADQHGITVSGPQMALGSGPKDSITAQDPIENKKVTYTFMVPFVKAFLHYVGQTQVPSIGYHVYGNMGELRWSVGEMHKQFGRPLWVTEYAWWNAPSPAEARQYMMQATDLFERTGYIEGYAWFKERADRPNNALLTRQPGKLTALGETYVNMPVHDADLYYRIPGRLEAEKYVTVAGQEIYPTTDADGFAQMASTESTGQLDYNLYITRPQAFKVQLRVSGTPGNIQILSRETVLATTRIESSAWQTLTTSITLPAGAQTISLRCTAPGQVINWILFDNP